MFVAMGVLLGVYLSSAKFKVMPELPNPYQTPETNLSPAAPPKNKAGRRTAQVAMAFSLLPLIIAAGAVGAYLCGLPSPTPLVRGVSFITFGATALAAVLFAVLSLSLRFRYSATIAMILGVLEIFVLMAVLMVAP